MNGMMNQIQSAPMAAIEQQIQANLLPQAKANYDKIVVAGMHAALAKGPNSLLASLGKSKDPIGDAAKGAVSLVMVLRREATGIMPVNAMVPAAMTLMLHALSFLDAAGIVKIGQPEIERTTHIFTNVMFASLHVSPAMIAHATATVHGITQDPVAMDHINRKIGAVRHPLASTPTIPGMAPVSPNAI